MKKIIAYILATLLISACGEGVVEVENKSYQPKISIDGFLQPSKKVDKIQKLQAWGRYYAGIHCT